MAILAGTRPERHPNRGRALAGFLQYNLTRLDGRGERLRFQGSNSGARHGRYGDRTAPICKRGSMPERFDLPVLPLRDTVVYPGVAVPISAGRAGTVEAVQKALDGDRRLFAVAQRENLDEASPEILYSVGTVVRIIQTHRVRGGVQLLVQGEDRAEALRYRPEGEGMLEANLLPLVRLLPRNPEDPAFQALDKELRDRAAELGTRRGVPAEALNQLIQGVDEPGSFADLVAFYLDLPTPDKQKLLEVLDDEERMRRALVAVERELARLDAQEDIQAKVQEELGERQREMLLREQMKQIQRELGDEDDRKEVEELRQRIQALDLQGEARTEVERELKRLERTSPQSAEYQVIRTYLEWITELPWNERTDDQIDLAHSAQILNEDHYGLDDVKDRILEFLAVRKLQMERSPREVPSSPGGVESPVAPGGDPEEAWESPGPEGISPVEAGAVRGIEWSADSNDDGELVGRGPILLFTGPPGVGKTSIAQSIARSLGRKYVRISLGGARDEADIRGHRRTYVGAMPGRILQGMRQVKSKNPVFLLDEIDKLGVSFQGDPSSALLEVLDPAQNSTFTDHYLGIPFDLSEVLFIATANYADRIPAPLLDRMERVEFSGYTEQEKLEIAQRYLLPRQRKETGLKPAELEMDSEAVQAIISHYTREAGVRQLEREMGKVARKVARKIAGGESEGVAVDAAVVRELLGRPRVHPEKMRTDDTVGVATGMFYTPMGGDIMFVEASVMPGEGSLVLTGQLGDVMKESGRAAWTFAKTHHNDFGIPDHLLKGVEVHIHVPAGAIPKDGPSAGITMATALISALSGRKVRRDVAMTGELTLTGRVLPIGGVKEKILGAVRAGIQTILVPEENEADLEDIPPEVAKYLTLHLVGELKDVLEHALVPEPARVN
jgi:ATP-dependent Lon protease